MSSEVIMKPLGQAIIMVLVLCNTIPLWAQDSSKVNIDTTVTAIKKTSENVKVGEIELMEITIEAVIEKPRVSILPKRLEPELGEMEFIDRSFENELKQGPEKPVHLEERVAAPIKAKEQKEKAKKDK